MTAYIPEAASHSRNENAIKMGLSTFSDATRIFLRTALSTALSTASLCVIPLSPRKRIIETESDVTVMIMLNI